MLSGVSAICWSGVSPADVTVQSRYVVLNGDQNRNQNVSDFKQKWIDWWHRAFVTFNEAKRKTLRLFLGQWFHQDFWDVRGPYICDKMPLGCALDFLVHFNIFNLLCWRDTAPKQNGMASFMELNVDKYVKMIFLIHSVGPCSAADESKIYFAPDHRALKDWHELCYFMWVFSRLFICKHSEWNRFHFFFHVQHLGCCHFHFWATQDWQSLPLASIPALSQAQWKATVFCQWKAFSPSVPSPMNSFSHSPTWFNPATYILFVTGIILF